MRRIYILLHIFSCCCISVCSKEFAKPKSGEGIYRFLINNGRNPTKHLDAFVELNKGKLGKNNGLIKGVAYRLPPLSNEISGKKHTTPQQSKKEPLFGKKYEEYPLLSNKLQGATFYLVSGHGGPDCGAIGTAGGHEIHEDEYAYDIMLRLARNLLIEGARVHIIIRDGKDGIRDERYLRSNEKEETCMGKEIPRNQKTRLQQRCNAINQLDRQSTDNYRRAIFIHLDSRSTKQQMDVYFYYHEKSPAGKKLGETLRTTIKTHYEKHQPQRGFTGTITARNLHVLVNTRPISIFTELGNIRNRFDQQRFLEVSNRQAIANWMCRGLILDYENSKK
jgi:N-acetylmuramoyl-L-alanine amidase